MEKKNTILWQQILVVASYVAMLVVNFLSNALPINGVTTQEISEKYANLFAPAGYTFAIWGVVYLLLGLYILFQFGVFKKHAIPSERLFSINNWFILLNLLNIAWVFAWHYDLILLSTIIILAMLVCLIVINLLINKLPLTLQQKLFVKVPFGVYFAWLTVATVANITTLLTYFNWNGFGLPNEVWMVIILIVVTIISVLTTLKLNCPAYALTIIWALVGILVQHLTTYNGQYLSVMVTTLLAIAIMLLTLVYLLFKNRNQLKATK